MKYDEFIRWRCYYGCNGVSVEDYISMMLEDIRDERSILVGLELNFINLYLDKDTDEYRKIMKFINDERPLVCPRSGKFIGYKKVYLEKRKRYYGIVTLEIPEDAKRSSAFGIKCRCSKAKVLDIEKIDGLFLSQYGCSRKLIPYRKYPGYSIHNNDFKYIIGETIEVDDFDECRWNECSTGIHFFMTKEEAMCYCP